MIEFESTLENNKLILCFDITTFQAHVIHVIGYIYENLNFWLQDNLTKSSNWYNFVEHRKKATPFMHFTFNFINVYEFFNFTDPMNNYY